MYPSIVANRWIGLRLELIAGLVIFFAAIFAVIARDTGISAEVVGLSITYALQMTLALTFLVRVFVNLETYIVANERIDEYSKEKTEADWITKPMVSVILLFDHKLALVSHSSVAIDDMYIYLIAIGAMCMTTKSRRSDIYVR